MCNSEEKIRINKYLASKGLCSRREADSLIEQGRVLINGTLPEPGDKVGAADTVTVDGKSIGGMENSPERVVLAYNKPVGVICSSKKQSKNDITLTEAVNYPVRLFPVGRLDKDSEGLLLLTNDGELNDYITRARNHHEKEYEVTLEGNVSDEFIANMSKGVTISYEDGSTYRTRPCRVNRLSANSFDIVLTEGKNRQIRRMCQALGSRVVKLKRVRVMHIGLDSIKTGTYRRLSEKEIEVFYAHNQHTVL